MKAFSNHIESRVKIRHVNKYEVDQRELSMKDYLVHVISE